MPSQTASVHLNFKIKLLSGNNVVLVDCQGYESELFIPQIINGRINFQNIIPNHRCCDAAAANVQTSQLILPACKLGDVRVPGGGGTPNRLNYEQHGGNLSAPLARSTPTVVPTGKVGARAGKENVARTRTPEQARCKPAHAPSPRGSSALNVMLLEKSSSFQLQVPPLNDSENRPMSSPPRPSPSTSLTITPNRDSALCNFMHKAPPARTYGRGNANATSQSKPRISWSPLQKKKKPAKVSSTKPPSPSMKLEVRQRKLIVDTKKSLAQGLHKTVNSPITKKKIRRKQVTGTTRMQFEALKGTAYDLLVSPGHASASHDLSQQFRDSCMGKYSETLPSYAELSGTAPLQMDRQVKSLIAREKRLAKPLTKLQHANLCRNKKPQLQH